MFAFSLNLRCTRISFRTPMLLHSHVTASEEKEIRSDRAHAHEKYSGKHILPTSFCTSMLTNTQAGRHNNTQIARTRMRPHGKPELAHCEHFVFMLPLSEQPTLGFGVFVCVSVCVCRLICAHVAETKYATVHIYIYFTV